MTLAERASSGQEGAGADGRSLADFQRQKKQFELTQKYLSFNASQHQRIQEDGMSILANLDESAHDRERRKRKEARDK